MLRIQQHNFGLHDTALVIATFAAMLCFLSRALRWLDLPLDLGTLPASVQVSVLLTFYILTAVWVDRLLARHTPREGSLPLWLRSSRALLGGVPLFGLMVLAAWPLHLEQQSSRNATATAPARRPSSCQGPLGHKIHEYLGHQELRQGWWVMGPYLLHICVPGLLMLEIPLFGTSLFAPLPAHLVLHGLCILTLSAGWWLTRWEVRPSHTMTSPTTFRWLILSWCLPFPVPLLAALWLLANKKSLIEQAFTHRHWGLFRSGDKLGRSRGWTSKLRQWHHRLYQFEEVESSRWQLSFSRFRRVLLALWPVEVAVFGLLAGALDRWMLTLGQRWLHTVIWLSVGLFALAQLGLLVTYVYGLWGRLQGRVSDPRAPSWNTLAWLTLWMLLGFGCGFAIGARDAKALILTLATSGGLLGTGIGLYLTTHLALPRLWQRHLPWTDLLGWVLGWLVLTFGLLGLYRFWPAGMWPSLEVLLTLAPLWHLLVGAWFFRRLLFPFSPRDLFAPDLPAPLRCSVLALALLAFLPLSAFAFPVLSRWLPAQRPALEAFAHRHRDGATSQDRDGSG